MKLLSKLFGIFKPKPKNKIDLEAFSRDIWAEHTPHNPNNSKSPLQLKKK